MKAAKPKVEEAVKESKLEITGFFPFGGESSVENTERLKAIPEIMEAQMIFAVGGGKAIDTGKVLAQRTERAELDKDNEIEFKIESGRQAYLVQIEGSSAINNVSLNMRDALEITEEDIKIKALGTSHFLVVEMKK